MADAVFMPRLGQSVESCIITEWVKKKGDSIKQGDVLFCYETDKASFEETAKSAGTLLEVFYNEGDEVPVLSNVAVIGTPGENIEEFRPVKGNVSRETTAVEHQTLPDHTETPVISVVNERTRISPRARKLAEMHKITLGGVKGSGPNGRIISRDVQTLIISPPAYPVSKNTSDAGSKTIPLSNIRKRISAAMLNSLKNSAQLTHHTSADARKLLALRAVCKSRYEKGELPDISINDLVCYATIRALEKMPSINSHYLGDSIRIFTHVHLGIAVDTERGLMVPVVRNADSLKLRALAVKIRELADLCRKGNIDPDLLSSENGSFTISNLGSYGVELFTPVLNLPQSGILGVNTITYRPADLGDGTIGIIPVIGLSLTYDHRCLDGAPASAFLREVRIQVESLSVDLI